MRTSMPSIQGPVCALQVCDCVAELASGILDEQTGKGWDQLLPFMFQCVQSGELAERDGASFGRWELRVRMAQVDTTRVCFMRHLVRGAAVEQRGEHGARSKAGRALPRGAVQRGSWPCSERGCRSRGAPARAGPSCAETDAPCCTLRPLCLLRLLQARSGWWRARCCCLRSWRCTSWACCSSEWDNTMFLGLGKESLAESLAEPPALITGLPPAGNRPTRQRHCSRFPGGPTFIFQSSMAQHVQLPARPWFARPRV